jgi:hypothetical protein
MLAILGEIFGDGGLDLLRRPLPVSYVEQAGVAWRDVGFLDGHAVLLLGWTIQRPGVE